MPESIIVRLPAELLLAILSYLPAEDLLKCKQLSHVMNDLVSSSAEMQYKIELFCGYQREMETYSGDISVSDRLQILQDVTYGWANLRFSNRAAVGYPLASSYVYEVSGGRLVLGSDLDHIASHLNGTSVLSVHEFMRPGINPTLAPFDADVVRRRDVHLDFPVADFAMDVHQNLLVLVQRTMSHNMKLYIRTLDGNLPHPNAAKPVLETQNQSWVTIHISGSILACLFVEPVPNATDFLIVWDWKTGDILGHITGRKQKSFVLISPSSLAVANLDQNMLDIYDIDQSAKTMTLAQSLYLPSVKGEEGGATWTYDDALLRCHPTPLPPTGSAASSGTLHPHTELPFTTDEEDGIVSCTFYCHSIGSSFTLVVHRSALRHIYNEHVEPRMMFRAGRHVQKRLIPWSDWGPENTRWINAEPSQRWICYVHGHRLAVLERKKPLFDGRTSASGYDSDGEDDPTREKRLALIQGHLERIKLGALSTDFSYMSPEEEDIFINDDSPGYHYLRVFDFNPRAIRRKAAEGKIQIEEAEATCETRAKRGQTLVIKPSLFQTYVTSLPYLETTVRLRDLRLRSKREHIEGVMMNAESIMIMMSHSAQAWSDGVDVLTV